MDNTGLSLKGSISFDLKADVWEMRQRVKKLGHYPDTAIYLRGLLAILAENKTDIEQK